MICAIALREGLKLQVYSCGTTITSSPIHNFQPATSLDGRIQQGKDLELEFISQSGQIQIASALANAFAVDVNQLPLSFVLSWYEQKAIAVLLTLLHLGIKNIRIGPTLPAFLTPNVINLLVQTYNLQPIQTLEQDLATLLGA